MGFIMKNKYLQTILTGCAWCKSVIDVANHEVNSSGSVDHIMISHGICKNCDEEMRSAEKIPKKTSEIVFN